MPPTTWEDMEFDSILLAVDRLTGLIVACPTLKVRLTAEKAVKLMWENGWELFGIPTTIHSDMGPQFVGLWWKALCAKLGIQQTFSQPYRPRANGKAERAGQQILTILRKLHMEKGLNWVQALPRALTVFHDTVGDCGLSPYQILFGRERAVQGIPFLPQRQCEDAVLFIDRMNRMQTDIAQAIMAHHKSQAQARNSHRVDREEYQVGDLVWVLKPHSMSTQSKMEPIWKGPLKIHQRVGHHSYLVQDRSGAHLSVHVDWLKPYVPLGEVGELAGLLDTHRTVQTIKGMRDGTDGSREYLVQWSDNSDGSTTMAWAPYGHLVALGYQGKVDDYHSSCAISRLP